MNLDDVTGKDPRVPTCPRHPEVALLHEYRPGPRQGETYGFWRCPLDNRVYTEVQPISPRV